MTANQSGKTHPLDGAFITTESLGGADPTTRKATFKIAFTGEGCIERAHAVEDYLKALVAADRAAPSSAAGSGEDLGPSAKEADTHRAEVWPVTGLSADERARAAELRDDPDSEDNERFASWYGDALLKVDVAYEASQEALADLVGLIDRVAPAYSACPMANNARTILGQPAADGPASPVGIGAADETRGFTVRSYSMPKPANHDAGVVGDLVEALKRIAARTTPHPADTVEDTAKDALKANAIARAALAKYATHQAAITTDTQVGK